MKMKLETLANLIQLIVFATLGLAAFIGALFYGAWWHLFTCVGCYYLSWIMYTDDAYDVESVKHYIQRKIKRNKSNYGNME